VQNNYYKGKDPASLKVLQRKEENSFGLNQS
jgi:hypothetical protein